MNPWHRVGFHYEAKLALVIRDGRTGVLTLTLGFVSYHLIRLIHGKQKLVDMVYEKLERDGGF